MSDEQDTTYSFVYDGKSALEQFKQVTPGGMIMALLATIPAEPSWDGCLVYEGESPLGDDTVCIATRGPGADVAQQRLIEGLERLGVRVLQVYDGGPVPRQRLASAEGGTWKEG